MLDLRSLQSRFLSITIKNRTGVINDPIGRTYSTASSNHYFVFENSFILRTFEKL